MALTKVSRGLLSTGIVDNSNATAITLNADESATFSGSVGIGNSSPSSYFSNARNLVVGGTTGANGMTISGSTDTQIFFADGTSGADAYRGIIRYSHADDGFSFWTNATRVLDISSAGSVGIGTSSPRSVTNYSVVGINGTSGSAIDFELGEALKTTFTQTAGQFEINVVPALPLIFKTSNSERMLILSNGSVVIGGTSQYAASATTIDQDGSFRSVYASGVGGDTLLGAIGGVSNGYQLTCTSGNALTYKWHTGANNNAMTLTNSGTLLVGTTGTTLGGSQVIAAGVESSHTTGSQTMTVYNSSTSCGANGIFLVGTARGANGTFDLFNCWTAGISDKEFKVRGDGNVFADGTFSGGGADYAEFFEWLDGNSSAEDRRGYSVVLDSGKIRVATSEDNASQIIGVISANPAMIGDNDMERWRGKYLRDDFGSHDLDSNGDKQLNPDYDEAQSYVSREDRVEWGIVGLMGKLRIHKGQPTGSNWIKIKDISAGIEEWLVR
jgi:hypothetical protein